MGGDPYFDVIIRSKHRQKIMRQLYEEGEVRHNDLADRPETPPPRVSEHLDDLAEHNLVECVNPDSDERARWYRLTEHGREVWEDRPRRR